jgi:hypothetical protein
MKALVKKNDMQLAIKEEAEELVGGSFGELLKFDANKSKFSIVGGDDVPIGRKYIAHCNQFARGYTKFLDKCPVEVRIKKVTEGRPPERKDLDEPEMIGRSDDPWVYQRFMRLEDCETGAIVTFVSKSVGGKIALGNLLLAYSASSDRRLPIIKLAVGSFRSREYGRRARPDFPVVGWTGGNRVEDPGPLGDPDDPGPGEPVGLDDEEIAF